MNELDAKILEAIKSNPELLEKLGISTKTEPVKKKRGRPKKVVEAALADNDIQPIELENAPAIELNTMSGNNDKQATRQPIKIGNTGKTFGDDLTLFPEQIKTDKKMTKLAMKNKVAMGRQKYDKVKTRCVKCSQTYMVDPIHVSESFEGSGPSFRCPRCF